VESSRSSETGGSGLGLAIAQSIIEMHGGRISAKSDVDGTVFFVVLKNEPYKMN
jgi:signal transduction histidine kinase